MIIKNKHAHYANAKMIVHTIGEIQLTDGIVEVPDNIGEEMIESDEWSDANADSAKGTDQSAKDSNLSISGQNSMTPEEKEELVALIKEMGHEELLKIAIESNIKGANLFKAPEKIETLRNLIIKNVQKIA